MELLHSQKAALLSRSTEKQEAAWWWIYWRGPNITQGEPPQLFTPALAPEDTKS